MKVAIVHDWIVDLGGAENVLKDLCQLFNPDVYTLFYKTDSLHKLSLEPDRVYSTFLQKLPFVTKVYRNLLPLFPLAVEQIDLSEYNVIISSSHTFAKSVITSPYQLHISYVYTPPRYLYDLYFQYAKDNGLDKGIKSYLFRYIIHKLRLWDYSTRDRPDLYIAISKFVAKRIKKYYSKDAHIIYPPVDTDTFKPGKKKDDYYLTVSRLVPNKKVDIIVKAFSILKDRKLVVVGDGPMLKSLKRIATKNVEILGYQPTEKVVELMQGARGFLFSSLEDFGISPVEAQACGTPVIAYAYGGILETVLDRKTGMLFWQNTPQALAETVRTFEKMIDKFDPVVIRKNGERFNRKRFLEEFRSFVLEKYQEFAP